MIKNFISEKGFEYYEDVSLKRYNTYRLNTVCKYLVIPKDIYELIDLLKFIKKKNIKYLVLGNGSNVIFSMDYYDGVIILLHQFNSLDRDGELVKVGSGYSLQRLSTFTVSLGLMGLEFATGIPGLVGASVAMNAGAYNASIADVLESVTVLTPDLEVIEMQKDEIQFSYRNSFFKENANYYILSACFKLNKGDKNELLERVSKRRVRRLETQPLDMPSAGSVFRNPIGMHAGELIEKCGLKGFSIGDAQVSEKHANFIVNTGNATGIEIIHLIDRIKREVKDKFDVDLVLEQIIIE